MFIMHISLILDYGILLASAALIIWAMRNEGVGSSFGKAIGSFVLILALFSMVCIGYYGIKYLNQGDFETPPQMSMPMRQEMMQKMMPMMMEKMMKSMRSDEQMGKMEMQKEESHSNPSH